MPFHNSSTTRASGQSRRAADADYPAASLARDHWILSRRPARNSVTPRRPSAFWLERERSETGEIVSVATIFLTNRECPWHCLMCDLWKNTLTDTAPAGSVPEQIRHALRELERTNGAGALDNARCVKLYNSGSFFDRRAIPEEDYAPIAQSVRCFGRVIVECHPTLVNERVLRFRDLLAGKLELALGLETVQPLVLERLNKRMTLDDFGRAAEFLRRHEISLRSFVLVKPPFMDEVQALEWAQRSIDFAFGCGAGVVSLIPVRFGNGALESLAARGLFSPPALSTLELAGAYGVGLRRNRVFVDLWNLREFSDCDACFSLRRERLEQMNERQVVPAEVRCHLCDQNLRGARNQQTALAEDRR
ncbi:MAG: hypothetical protein L0Z50_11705 [Verrucomicrobiales bacterium]|nr:hypothetical protein [Verrucomicrobiales bacterium]